MTNSNPKGNEKRSESTFFWTGGIRILLGLTWACGALIVAAGVIGWTRTFGTHNWAPAIITTVFALLVLGAAVRVTVLMRRHQRQVQRETDASSDDGE